MDEVENVKKEFAGAGAAAERQRNWRGIGIALLVISVICTMIIAAVLIFTPLTAFSLTNVTEPLSLTDVVFQHFHDPHEFFEWSGARRFTVKNHRSSVLEGKIGHIAENETLTLNVTYSMLLDKENLIVDRTTAQFRLSHDRRFVMLQHSGSDSVLQPSNRSAFYDVFSRDNMTYTKIGLKTPSRPATSAGTQPALQAFLWNPKSNDFVYVYKNDIYYAPSIDSDDVRQLTSGGASDGLLNGVFDWVYSEEIFEHSSAMWWSPSGDQLAYAITDDRSLSSASLLGYVAGERFPRLAKLPYPMQGTRWLPKVQLAIWSRSLKNTALMDVLLRNSTGFHYLYSVSWAVLYGKEVVVAVWTNRFQNEASITLCRFETQQCALIFEQTYKIGDMQLWALPQDFLRTKYSNDSLFVKLPREKADDNVYTHIARLHVSEDLKSPAKQTWLSIGNYDVVELVRYDAASNRVFFIAAAPQPTQRHLFAAQATASPNASVAHIVTSMGPKCTYQQVDLSSHLDYASIHCQGPSSPKMILVKWNPDLEIYDPQSALEILHDEDFERRISKRHFPVAREERIPMSHGLDAHVKLLLPHDYNTKTLARAIPVVVYVYGGPGTQAVADEYKVDFNTFLVSTRKYAVLQIDGRGSGFRGWKYRSQIYGRMGSVEIEDQIEALRHVLARHSFLDATRVAIWGWSYGGFAAANAVQMDRSGGLFRCAVSIAPVSNFKYYDATYTERYMGDAPERAYESASLTRNVSAFQRTKLFTAHGLSDDNVHFLNSAVFIEQLQRHDVQFELQVYPNQNHHIHMTRRHLFTAVDDFLTRCFTEN